MADLETKNSAVATKESDERKVKMRSLALDLVPMGTDEENRMADLKVTKTLPEGIESKMLYGDIIHIAWPSLVELTLTQLASMVDLMMVGQLGPWALTAVGLTTQPKFLMMTMFMAMNVGATAMVARYKGAGNQKKADEVLRQALLMTFVIGMVFAVVGFITAPWLIKFMGASEAHVLEASVSYLRIQMIGLPGLALTSTITATLRGVGNSKTAMIYNAMANIINVFFNYMLIYGNFGAPRMEVSGASLATIIGQYCAMFMAFYAVMNGRQYIILRFRDGFKPNMEEIRKIVDIGVPAMIEQLVMRVGLIIYTRTVAGLGTLAYAVHQVCLNIQSLSFMNGQAFAVSATSLMGQSLGKKRHDMAQAYTSRARKLGMCVSIILGVVFFFFGGQIVALYSGGDQSLVDLGAIIMMFVAVVQPFQSSQLILAGALRGAGDTKVTAVITFLTVLLVRPTLAIFAINVLGMGLEGAWYALVIDQILRSLLVLLRYNSGAWKRHTM